MAKSSSSSADLAGERKNDAPLIDAATFSRKINEPASTTKAGKIIPQNPEAEKSLLGAVLIDEEVLADIADKVSAKDFYDPRHELVFAAMLRLYEKHTPVDLLTLTEELRKSDDLKSVGGAAYLSELTNYVPSSAHATS